MSRKLAVMFVHGVEIDDSQFAATASRRLGEAFARHAGADPEDVLAIRPAYWAPLLQERQDELLRRLGGGRLAGYFDRLSNWGGGASGGGSLDLLKLAASGLMRRMPRVPGFHYPTLRWVAVHYLGDAVAYQVNTGERELYDQVHAVLARTLGELADEAGDDAPLCVIAHSLGTVVASNFFYDLQVRHGRTGSPARPLVKAETAAALRDTPLGRGETLTHLYTMGSPLALWSGRLSTFGDPLLVPDPASAGHHPQLVGAGEWVNIHDPDDVVSWPLKPLNSAYDKAVTEDREVSITPWWLGWTPLVHPGYWNDAQVMEPIGKSLAQAWKSLSAEEARADA